MKNEGVYKYFLVRRNKIVRGWINDKELIQSADEHQCQHGREWEGELNTADDAIEYFNDDQAGSQFPEYVRTREELLPEWQKEINEFEGVENDNDSDDEECAGKELYCSHAVKIKKNIEVNFIYYGKDNRNKGLANINIYYCGDDLEALPCSPYIDSDEDRAALVTLLSVKELLLSE